MLTVELTFAKLFDLQSALEQVLEGALPSDKAAQPGTCRLRIVYQGHSLELFALAKPGLFRLTDEPADLRFQVAAFREQVEPTKPAGSAAPAAPASAPEPEAEPTPPSAEEDEEAAAEPEAMPDATELAELQVLSGTTNPIMAKVKHIQKLGSTQRLKLGEEGDLVERTLLYRMYGKMMFEALLRNPRISEVEVAKLAKLGTIASNQLLIIARKGDWVRAERIRNALLGNPRLPLAAAQKILQTLSKHELRPLMQRRDFPPQVQTLIKDASLKLSGAK